MSNNVASMTSRSESVFAVTIAFFACATLFVFFRLLSRIWIVRKVMLDDWFILLAWILTFGLCFSICYGTTVGLGRHEVDVPAHWQKLLRESQYAFAILYQPSLMMEKTSILVFYLTLSQPHRIFKWATLVTLFVVNAAGFALLMATAFQCNPVAAAWKFPTPPSQCTDIITIYLASAPVNIITDLAMLFLPMPILTGMRLPRKQKAILVVTFGFGVFVAVVDIIRVAYLQNAATYRISRLSQDVNRGDEIDATDFSWNASFSFMWSAIEVCVGIMVACVPALKPLFSRFLPHFIHDAGFRTGRSNSDHTAEMVQAHRIPSIATRQSPVIPQNFTPMPAPAEDQEMGMQDFLNIPVSHPQEAHTNEQDMGMADFLTVPGMDQQEAINRLRRTETGRTNSSRDTGIQTPTWFDFVTFENKKSMVYMTNRESIFPIAAVTVLFFIWGFEYGLLAQLNAQFQTVAHDTPGQQAGLHAAYFAGYAVAPPTFGRLVLKHWGFKACYSVGLSIYACGTLVFWVAAVLTSFPTYIVVNFVVAMGLSTLEIAANPFVLLCGPPKYAAARLNLSQGFQAIGSVIAPVIASKAWIKLRNDKPSLVDTQWAYLGIALFTVALAIAYYYIPLPEATDEELEDASERIDHANKIKYGKTDLVWIILGVGAFSQFCYVGAQETFATTFFAYMAAVKPDFERTQWLAIAHGAFAGSRFVAAGLSLIIKPRFQLLFWYTAAIIFSALTMNFSGETAVALIVVVFFLEGPIFNLVFAQSIRGLGKHTKNGSALVTASVSGGAVFPAISYAVAQSTSSQYSLCIGVAAFAAGTVFPIMLNVIPPMRRIVDPTSGTPPIDDPDRPTSAGSSTVRRMRNWMKTCKYNGSKDGSVSWRERMGSGDTTTTDASRPL
ncbi:hypothetical protein MBLNU457_g0434t1 [Dothideomycetes sp. NU457]